jgi:hypothetical protein
VLVIAASRSRTFLEGKTKAVAARPPSSRRRDFSKAMIDPAVRKQLRACGEKILLFVVRARLRRRFRQFDPVIHSLNSCVLQFEPGNKLLHFLSLLGNRRAKFGLLLRNDGS